MELVSLQIMKRLLTILLAANFVTIGWSAKGQSSHCLANRYSQDALFDSTDIQITTNVHYATSMRWPGTEMDSLRMDIYQPDPNIDPLAERPLIVMTHGGSFAAGNRTAMAYYCMEMARRGFVTATISYRLGWNCNVAAADPCIACQGEAWRTKVATYRAVQDNRAAIRHLIHNASDFGIDTGFVFLQGESAGSITSLNSTFWNQAEADAWCANCTSEVGLLDTAGNQLTDAYSIKGVINQCGAIALLDNMDGHDVPVVGFHNNPDCLVPYGGGQVINCLGCAVFYWVAGSAAIRARLEQNGVCYELNSTTSLFPAHCNYGANGIIRKSACFLKGILCDSCVSSTSTNNATVSDCSYGGTVSIDENEAMSNASVQGTRLVFGRFNAVSEVRIYDLSMRLLEQISVNRGASEIQLPIGLRGCMLIRINTENRQSEALKWCSF
jgi:hypothetical protein